MQRGFGDSDRIYRRLRSHKVHNHTHLLTVRIVAPSTDVRVPENPEALRATLIDETRGGARLGRAYADIGIRRRPYNRWREGDGIRCDDRPEAVRPEPANKLSAAEYQAIMDTMHRPEFRSLPPDQVVPALADREWRYIASKSTFYRTLRAR